MTVISYAQNGEDIVLSRALAHISNGFYIDVGAQDPTVDSVTRYFYERGWRGVNIEPVRYWHARLEQERPEDVNLCVAVGDHSGEISLYEVVGTGLSTTVGDVASRHAATEREVIEKRVPMTTLDDICAARHIGQVHFLKIDVEGAEASVLHGISLDRIRPWIILVEATEPNTQVPTHEGWEPLLTAREYEFIYADGLNRFYLAREHQQLRSSFALPPNYFDDFITYREHTGREYATGLESKLETLHAQATGLREELARTQAQGGNVQDALDRVVAERGDLLAKMEVVRATAESRQSRIEQIQAAFDRVAAEHEALASRSEILRAAAEARAARIEQLGTDLNRSVVESTKLRVDMQVLLETAQNRQNRIVELHAQLETALRDLASRDAALSTVLHSHSWRLTRPLRVMRRIVSRRADLSAAWRWLGRAVGRRLRDVAWIRNAANLILRPYPVFRARLSGMLHGKTTEGQAVAPGSENSSSIPAGASLSVRECEVLSIFTRAARSKDSEKEIN
jgi:FkbM family methyltransferase